jgi:hypothetical protein
MNKACGTKPTFVAVDVFIPCRLRDLLTLKLAIVNLQKFCPIKEIIVATSKSDVVKMQRSLGAKVFVCDEDKMIPGMTLAELACLPIASFPKGAGWYFQQLLKFAFCFQRENDDNYLTWDADTVPLRPMEFFDPNGKLILTRSGEHHLPYFETYERLLGYPASYEFSFISQHMPIRKKYLREMLAAIENRIPGNGNWAWKIMSVLPTRGFNLFSEYETYGYYMQRWHADEIIIRSIPWLREGSQAAGFPPRQERLPALAEKYFFVSFEAREYWPYRFKRAVARLLKRR